MRNNRKAALFFTDKRMPVYEGDMIKVFFSKKGKRSVRWYPRSCDYRTPDMTRLSGRAKYVSLDQNEYAALETIERLTLLLQPTERTRIYRVGPEKRNPLLRVPARGLAPRWA
jgi:hypothetical protein